MMPSRCCPTHKFHHSTSWQFQATAVKRLKHYNARPSSEQLRSCSDILSSAMGGMPQQSQQPTLPGPSNPLSLKSMVVNDSRNTAQQFVKYQPQALSSLFSNCQVNNVQVFMGHNSAGFH